MDVGFSSLIGWFPDSVCTNFGKSRMGKKQSKAGTGGGLVEPVGKISFKILERKKIVRILDMFTKENGDNCICQRKEQGMACAGGTFHDLLVWGKKNSIWTSNPDLSQPERQQQNKGAYHVPSYSWGMKVSMFCQFLKSTKKLDIIKTDPRGSTSCWFLDILCINQLDEEEVAETLTALPDIYCGSTIHHILPNCYDRAFVQFEMSQQTIKFWYTEQNGIIEAMGTDYWEAESRGPGAKSLALALEDPDEGKLEETRPYLEATEKAKQHCTQLVPFTESLATYEQDKKWIEQSIFKNYHNTDVFDREMRLLVLSAL
eukprot:Lithocolla_globosa_v1_NODE_3791_length_1578_cov_6.979645.p1 type:complete len:316 gc:universal NODE_3791_length_1578_cov_6.979645:90-1037(+)